MRKVALSFLALATLAASAPAVAAAKPKYRAQITRTAYGIPHITASGYGGAGFGMAYAYAQDNLCTIAQQVVTTRARRSYWFGPDAHTIASAQNSDRNLDSDFFWQQVKDRKLVEKQLARKAPQGPSGAAKAMIRGYVAGYNAYLRKVGRKGIPDPRCRGKRWVVPITVMDAWRRAYQLALLGSGTVFLHEQVAAQPPGTQARAARAAVSPATAAAWWRGALKADEPMGSNGVGLGSQGTKNHDGMLLANPHFPWIGSERFYQFQLHVPGRLNVQGSSLGGAPIVNIGFNRHTAWTHTVSTGRRFTIDRLDLVPGSPTSYRYDGKTRKMTSRTVKVRVRGGAVRSHTFWYSRTGTIFNLEQAGYLWDRDHAYALHDANATNLRVLDVWLAMDKARSVYDLVRAQSRIQGVPWVNTMAADDKGRALYQDNSVTPHVTAAQVKSCIPAGFPQAVYATANVITLDGSTSKCAWGRDKDAVEPGIFGRSHLPVLVRRDFVQNSNDSYWLSNPLKPLTGFSPIIGLTRTPQGERTRYGVRMIQKRLAGTDGLKGKGFSLADLRAKWSRFDSEGGRLVHKQVAALCRDNPTVTLDSGEKVDVSAACPVFQAWNARANLDSKGAWLFQVWWNNAGAIYASDSFDPDHPLTTPTKLARSKANIQALGIAVKSLKAHGLPLNATMRQAQYVNRHGKRIPIPGCDSGCYANIAAVTNARGQSAQQGTPVRYGQVIYSSSTVQQVELTKRGPRGTTILTYSESENPRSKHYGDQTRLFSRGGWIPITFSAKQIAKAAKSRIVVRGG